MNFLCSSFFNPKTNIFVESLLPPFLGLLLMFVFELASKADVKHFRDQKGGKELHNKALRYNVFHHLVFGPITYYITVYYCCQSGPLTIVQQACGVLKFLLIEGYLYYMIHRAFHEVPGFYRMHKFHHQFDVLVLPSSASAVSIAEFLIAYMFPFTVGAWFGSCDKWSALIGATIVSLTNLCIHTPALEDIMSSLPWIFVSTSDHMLHHRRQRHDYSAPVFHYDRILHVVRGFLETGEIMDPRAIRMAKKKRY